MIQSRTARHLATLLVGALALAACGGDDDDSPSATAPDSPAATDAPADSAAPGTTTGDAESDASAGGELIVAVPGETAGFDPAVHATAPCCGSSQSFAVYASLVVRGEDGLLEPLLAESFDSPDGLTWTLVLKDGITFTDGTPLDAEAVKYNIERHQNPDIASVGKVQADQVVGMTVVDPLTLEIELAAPNAAFPWAFTTQMADIGSPTAMEALGDEYNAKPVGAGPFVLERWAPDDETVLVPNPNWIGEGPFVDRLIFRPIADNQQRLDTLFSGDVHIALATTPAEIASIEEHDGFTKLSELIPANQISVFNTTVAPFDDVRMRRAWAMATDLDAMNEVVFNGLGQMSRGISVESSPWYVDDIALPEFDPDAARALVAEYEAENGPIGTIRYTTGTAPDMTGVAEFLQASMSAIGVTVEIESIETTAFIAKLTDGDYQVGQFGISGHDDPALGPRESLITGSSRNRARFSNARVDELFELIASSTDFDERYEAYAEIQQIVADELPWAPWRAVESAQLYDAGVLTDVTGTISGVLRTDLIRFAS